MEAIIDFDKYFFDTKTHKPTPDQVIARFTAIASLESGKMKQDIIKLLYLKDKAESAISIMRQVGFSTEKDAIRVVLEIAEDLSSGMKENDVLNKSYKFQIEKFYYTKQENIPDDPHWSCISILKS